ncbi:MAG: 50S ribosome-binding GTPase, partial [Rhodospirillales bacterium]|nr:50S ribosome-binding GTPase [Rhodospirillales bacterium]
MTGVEIEQWIRRGQQLLERTAGVLANAESEAVRSMADQVPTEMVPERERCLSMVFVGQYSAGKSTVLQAMTGRDDIAVGAEITTQAVQEFDWNGIVVIDTPGIHTEIRPDHDEMTYRAISTADLLVFVITNELFDSHLGAHFRELAVTRDKAHEMMLVVNKMQRSVAGNTPDVRDVIRNDLRKVLAPFTPEELRISFTDAALAVEARHETDSDVRHLLERKSGLGEFLKFLNGFVRDKGLAARYTTELYALEQALQEALARVPTDEPSADAIEGLLVQERRALLDTQQQLAHEIAARIRKTSSAIRSNGREVADLIHGNVDQDCINQALEDVQKRTNLRSEQLAKEIVAILEEQQERLDDRVRLITESEFAKDLLKRLQREFKTSVPGGTAASYKQFRDASEGVRKLGDFLTRHSFDASTETGRLFALGQHSGTPVHEFVKGAGHLFG